MVKRRTRTWHWRKCIGNWPPTPNSNERSESCHTALVDGYVNEGHVPVEAVNKLFAERLNVMRIVVPGMVRNSPGMDQMKPGTLTVYEIAKAGEAPEVFSVE